jgi:transposase-like protein
MIFVRLDGKVHYLWRANDDEGEVRHVLVQFKRNRRSALTLPQSPP